MRLDNAHKKPDAAVFAAYGWGRSISAMMRRFAWRGYWR